MTPYQWFGKYGNFVSINVLVIVIVVNLMIARVWTLAGFILLALGIVDLFSGRALKKKYNSSASVDSTKTGGRFFRFYAYMLVAGGVIWFIEHIKGGISWFSCGPSIFAFLLAKATWSIGKRN